MKRILYACLCIAVLGYSCKKEKSGGDNVTPNTYKVSFSVAKSATSLVQAQRGLALTTNTTTISALTSLDYLVYNSAGDLIHQVKQSSTSSGFGTINDNLAPGTYHVIFIGNGGANLNTAIGTNKPSYTKDVFYVNPGADLFYLNDTLTVSSSNINQSIVLNRLTSQLRVKSTTVVPTKIDSLHIVISDLEEFYCATGSSVDVAGTLSYKKTLSHVFTAAEKGTSGFQMSSYVYNTHGSITVLITQYYHGVASPGIYVSSVQCYPNTITNLTGAMFLPDPNTPAGFQVSFDPDWNVQNLTF